ncbi:MAG: amidohydrolase family protein [Hyphomicrobiales bacterium]
MSQDIDLLVGADVLYSMSEGGEVVLGGELAIRGDRIVHAGPAQPPGTWKARQVISGHGKAVLPGFVNCHSHTASLVFRSQSDDGVGGAALYTVAFRAEKDIGPEEWRDLAHLGVIDMIKAGVTTINDIWYEPEALAEAALAGGLRAQIANKIFDVRLENLHAGDYTRHHEEGQARLRRGVAVVEKWHGAGDGLITGRIGPHASDTCSAELLREASQEARRLAVGTHVHVAQSQHEADHVRAQHGKGPAEYLADVGLLDEDSVVAHLTYAGAGDLDAVGQSGANYAHCSTIYPRRGVYPDVAAITARDIPWGLATDWMMNDPFEAMRNALNALRLRQDSVAALSTAQALWRATAGSARVLGLQDEVGQLAAGYKADLIQVDLDQPHLAPFYADHASLVYYARASDVVTSVVAGKVVMAERRVLGLDEAQAMARVQRHLPRWTELMRGLGGVGHSGLCGCGGA